MPKMKLDNGLVRITNDNETFEMAKMVIEGNREVEIYLQLPMPTNLLSWSQSIPKANDIGSFGNKPVPDLVNTIDESDSEDLFFEDKKKTFVVLFLGGDEEYEFLFDDFEFDPEHRRKSGILITELDKDQPLSQNKSGTKPPQTSQLFRNGVNNSRAAGFDKIGIRADNLGVDTEFHDAAYEEDETPFILDEQFMNENSQWNRVFDNAEGGEEEAPHVDSDYENDLRNVRHGDERNNGQKEAPIFNENVDMSNPHFQLGIEFSSIQVLRAVIGRSSIKKKMTQSPFG